MTRQTQNQVLFLVMTNIKTFALLVKIVALMEGMVLVVRLLKHVTMAIATVTFRKSKQMKKE